MKQKIFSKNAPPPIGPYSQAIIANNMMFLSGQIAINPNTNLLVVDSIENETNMVLKNIQNILQENQCSMNEIIKCTIFLSDMNLFEKVNKVYEKYFNIPYPARETVQVSGLPKNVNVEISVIAMCK
ncbi:MAG: reactive intermediate/imine deaminase [Flavobacteriales bacterium]|jgi:2-iminobutanoate/2-iminopropanoate deaminase|nr:reactive intermediate/imine deaminase [Flavobacteriales bacterium]|tara:strand:+ start:944 stop:1324 length:381 start_codon:yes stop_codon:yes gene_type:complete